MIWEKRWHPLRREWVTITSHRNQRPWSGASATTTSTDVVFDPECYLCPGNTRVGGSSNPDYADVHVFDNDHPSFSLDAPPASVTPRFYQQGRAAGICRVMCYSPDHSQSLTELDEQGVVQVFRTWAAQTRELAAVPEIEQVFIFENKGEVVGVSNPHPHCQIYATDFVPKTIEEEIGSMEAHLAETGHDLMAEIVAAEREDGRRVLSDDVDGIAFVPYFARFPYETYIVPSVRHASLADFSDGELAGFARHLHAVVTMYDKLWHSRFPYILVVHQAPVGYSGDYHTHIQLHPPMRAPGLQKFLAGTETGGGCFMNDGCPEDKAAELRATLELSRNI